MAASVDKNTVRLLYLSEMEADLFDSWKGTIQENTALMIRLLQLDQLARLKPLFAPRRILFWEADRF